MNQLEVRVASKVAEALDVCLFELVSATGAILPAFSAGSHIDVALPGGLTRQYSLCNDAGENHRYVIGVLKDPHSRGGSLALHKDVKVGDLITISVPKNHFALAHGARHSLLLAGGIGITPILCMAQRLASTSQPFELHYCTRSSERTAFLQTVKSSSFAERVRFHFDNGPETQKLDVGKLLQPVADDTHIYVCGPKGFMDAVLGTARRVGWPEERLHFEFFGAEMPSKDPDCAFEVQLASSGQIIRVPKDKSVVQALDDAGVRVMTSCEQGVCGTCITRVLEGEPDHRDLFLTTREQAANDQFLPCCSRSKSPRLVLDL